MTEDKHKYTFSGFPGSYWEQKAKRESAEARKARQIERASATAEALGWTEVLENGTTLKFEVED